MMFLCCRLRQTETNKTTVFQTIIFALLLGFIWLNDGSDKSGITTQAIIGLLTFSVVNNGFTGANTVLFTFPKERPVVLKERASRTYRLSAYFWSKTIVDLPRIFLTNMLFLILVYFMVGLRSGAQYFFGYYAVLVLAQVGAESIGYAVSAAAPDAMVAGATLPIFM